MPKCRSGRPEATCILEQSTHPKPDSHTVSAVFIASESSLGVMISLPHQDHYSLAYRLTQVTPLLPEELGATRAFELMELLVESERSCSRS